MDTKNLYYLFSLSLKMWRKKLLSYGLRKQGKKKEVGAVLYILSVLILILGLFSQLLRSHINIRLKIINHAPVETRANLSN